MTIEDDRDDQHLSLLSNWEIGIELRPHEPVTYEMIMKHLPPIDEFFQILEVRVQRMENW